jgi:hypothetical protein
VQRQKWLGHQATLFPDKPEKREKMMKGWMQIGTEIEIDWKNARDAYRNVFAYRFAERDGLTAPALLTDLDKIIVPVGSAGPLLVIPPLPR